MGMSVRRFRSEVREISHGKAPRGVRYPVAVREAAVALGRQRLRRGCPLARIAQELGISEPTLAGWLRPRATATLRPVVIEPEPARSRDVEGTIVLSTAQGLRVEGLDRDALIAVLRALA